jgi:predicted phage terminase large subunit-like protein
MGGNTKIERKEMSTTTGKKKLINALGEPTEIAFARSGLLYFTLFTFKEYSAKWYHKLLCKKLDNLLVGKIKRLMVFMPPQRGKSELVSRRLPAYALGKNPALKIAACSYSSDLSEKFNREVQRIIDTAEYDSIFPETKLNRKNVLNDARGSWLRNSSIFEIVKYGGAYKSVGVMGPLTGNKVDLGIIDDPIKDRLESSSETFRNRLWEWYIDVFCTRLHNDSGQLLTMTRWHEDDLAGRILSKEGNKWEILSLPELREDNNNQDDPRKIGEPLWPERHNLQTTLDLKSMSERTFVSMYQQRPAPSEGGIFKEKWFKYYASLPGQFDKLLISVDCAFKDKETNDYVAIGIFGKRDANIYMVDLYHGHWGFVDTIKIFTEVCAKYREAYTKLIEDKANGTAIIEVLSQKISGIVPINPTESKEARAEAVSIFMESGNFYLPENSLWVEMTKQEMKSFPNGTHDDIVDVITQALKYLFIDNNYGPIEIVTSPSFSRQ